MPQRSVPIQVQVVGALHLHSHRASEPSNDQNFYGKGLHFDDVSSTRLLRVRQGSREGVIQRSRHPKQWFGEFSLSSAPALKLWKALGKALKLVEKHCHPSLRAWTTASVTDGFTVPLAHAQVLLPLQGRDS